MEVLGTIGSLAVVLLLIALSVLTLSVVVLVVLGLMAGSMVADRRGLWRRLTRHGPLGRGRDPRLTLRRSGDAAPARLRAKLSGSTPGTRRRFLLGGSRPGGHGRGGDPRGSRIHGPRPVERQTRL